MFKLQDSARKKILKIPTDKTITIYTCGPTAYDYAHIGNFRSFLWEDILVRTLRYGLDTKVFRVMNFTDVDDKTIKHSVKNNVPLNEYTQKYIDAFKEDSLTLKILPSEANPRATHYIKEIIEFIENLIDSGHAYVRNSSVYFNISSCKKYGVFKKICLCSAVTENDDDEVETSGNFVLWKAWDKTRDCNIFWDSPWGRGRPGWHIECSAMILHTIGDTVDIHAGGIDNIFPHHENEIAQSESLTNKPLAKCWMHIKHLICDGKKMSKSLGNFHTVKSLLSEGFSGEEIRYSLLSGHYSTEVNFTKNTLLDARSSLKNINECIRRLHFHKQKSTEFDKDVTKILEKNKKDFISYMADDINVAKALSVLFSSIKVINNFIDNNKMGAEAISSAKSIFALFSKVLGFDFIYSEDFIPENVKILASERDTARKNKDWKTSDDIRDKIKKLGFVITDEFDGYKIFRDKSK